MLAVRPPPPHWRGRSRQISHAALARQASEERRIQKSEKTCIHDAHTTPSAEKPPLPTLMPSPSSDYYDSPPSPPRSLEHQVHVAYALDDMHLARVLLLRLKGITVTSPDDPRIAAVKDEDFDFCFVPHGRLMDEPSEAALKERQRIELEALQQRKRQERLKQCELVWDTSKRSLREAKAAAASRRRVEQQERTRRQLRPEQSRRPMKRPPLAAAPARVVAYKLVDATPPRDPEPFVYDFMPPHPITSSRPKTKGPSLPKSKSPSPFSRSRSRPLFDDMRAVPFSDVLASMQGPLFPQEPRRLSKPNREAELFNTLLRVVEWEADERRKKKGKGKAVARPLARRQNSASDKSSCVACSASSCSVASTSSTASSSVSPAPSSRSWLSFSSASSSASTAATTPSTSPTRKVRPKSWLFASPAASPPPPPAPSSSTHSCTPCTHLTPVAPADSPLPLDHVQSQLSTPSNVANTTTTASSSKNNTEPVHPPFLLLHHRLSHLLDLAKGFQYAYMNATMFAIPSASSPDSSAAAATALRARLDLRRSARRTPGKPAGQRASRDLVRAFLDSPPSNPNPNPPPPPPASRPILLRTRRASSADAEELELDDPPRTTLSSPLPYKLHFKPHPPPCWPLRLAHAHPHPHSSFSSHSHSHSYYPDASPTPSPPDDAFKQHTRVVENPLFLRVLAAGNVATARRRWGVGVGFGMGLGGEEVVLLREGALGSGSQTVRRVAGVFGRRSALGVEAQVRMLGEGAGAWRG